MRISGDTAPLRHQMADTFRCKGSHGAPKEGSIKQRTSENLADFLTFQ